MKFFLFLSVFFLFLLVPLSAQVNIEMFKTTFSYNELFEQAMKFGSDGRMDTLELLFTIVKMEAEELEQDLEYMKTVPIFSVGFMDFVFNVDVLKNFGHNTNRAIYMSSYAKVLSRMVFGVKVRNN